MATPATCWGFTHPVVLLIRSSLPQTAQRSVSILGRAGTACSRQAPQQRSIRLFTTSMRQWQQVKAKPKASQAKGTARAPSSSNRPTASSSYAHALAQRPGGAVLYEGGGQKVFIISSYMAGLVCMGGAAFNVFFNVYNVPAGVPQWTAYAFGSVGLMLAILGMNFILKPANIVRSIKLLPVAAEAASKTKTAGYSAPAKLQVEVQYRRLSPIPGLPLKKVVVEPRDVVLKARMYNPRPFVAHSEPTMAQQWVDRKNAEANHDQKHILTAPFRDATWVFSGFFASLRRGLTGEGFAPIEVKGDKLKLDIMNGYVLEEGKAMDRILRIEEEEEQPGMLFKRV